MRQNNDDETELVATSTVILGENVHDREVCLQSDQHMGLLYDCKRRVMRIYKGGLVQSPRPSPTN